MTTTIILLEEIDKIYSDKIQKIHEIPKKILSNKGPDLSYGS